MINSPMFCLTSDIDWSSDYCIEDFVNLVASYGIKTTLFATHSSPIIEKFLAANKVEVGIHPNFLPGSSHGKDYLSVIENMFVMYPNVKTFRSHCYFDNSHILEEMVKRGVRYDSNICLFLQPNVVPLNMAVGLTRLPVFWEDDVHLLRTHRDWNLEN